MFEVCLCLWRFKSSLHSATQSIYAWFSFGLASYIFIWFYSVTYVFSLLLWLLQSNSFCNCHFPPLVLFFCNYFPFVLLPTTPYPCLDLKLHAGLNWSLFSSSYMICFTFQVVSLTLNPCSFVDLAIVARLPQYLLVSRFLPIMILWKPKCSSYLLINKALCFLVMLSTMA